MTDSVQASLISLLGPEAVKTAPEELVVYECDGFTIPRGAPLAVVFPRTVEEVVGVVNLLRERKVPVLPRGSGTGLTGGIVSVVPGVQVSLARMNRIVEVDLRNRAALVEAGVTNGALSAAVAFSPYYYAPDPSSQRISTIGGNVATNAGGLHTLKYGVTVNHVLGIEVVLEDGTVESIGGRAGHGMGPDVAGLICGTEGTLCLMTKIWCRLTPKPAAFRTALAIFNSTQEACRTVAEIIAAGIIPAAMEMMDGPMIATVEEAFHLGLPRDAQALLLIEIDGQELGMDDDLRAIEAICRKHGARRFDASSDAKRRAELWSARRRAFAAIGRISPSYCTQDACVPRSRLPEVIARIAGICEKYRLPISNIFHAGDGNIHPVLLYDDADEDSVSRAMAASAEILRYAISIGGTITGEHGVGIEKLPYMRDLFSADDLAAMHRIRGAFSPGDLMNPFKTLPREGVQIDLKHPMRKVPQ